MEQAALMFSGGVDSTVTAVRLAREHGTVHLLTFSNGHGHFFMRNAAKRCAELTARFNNLTHTFIPVDTLFDRLIVRSLRRDYAEYRSGFIWCLGCKITMHAAAALYCLRNGISLLADGSSKDTAEMVEQDPYSVSLFREFHRGHGIEYTVPDYGMAREEKIRLLKSLGLREGFPVGSRRLGIQPRCIPGELYYLPRLLLGCDMGHGHEAVGAFMRGKFGDVETYLREELADG
jgi:PP-loop superfamily ATP-utilizing enzyme